VTVSIEGGRKPYLDGLRGFAALAVFIGHLSLVVLPDLEMLRGDYGWGLIITQIGKSPLDVLWNGSSAVCVFFVLSGYVMTDLGKRSRLNLPAQIVRRYLRLAIPVLITSTSAYLLMREGLMHNHIDPDVTGGWLARWYDFGYSDQHMVYEALIGTFHEGSDAYNPNLWTMHPEFLGSVYVIVICAIAPGRTIGFALLAGYYYADFILLFAIGALLNDYETEISRIGPRTAIALFLVGMYMCSMPNVGPEISLPWHAMLPRIFHYDDAHYWHSIGATLIVLGLQCSSRLQAIFASRIGRELGRMSFTLYLIHIPILCSFTAWLVLAVHGWRPTILLVGGGATIILVLGTSWLLSGAVDGLGIRVSREAGRLLTDPFRRAQPAAETPTSAR
jgi:peptidoglycan/LPS O-acetylase OafA/YrhL